MIASTSARLKRIVAARSIAASVCERSPSADQPRDSTAGASTVTAATTSPSASRTGAMPDTQTP